jgi:hypothetical protein
LSVEDGVLYNEPRTASLVQILIPRGYKLEIVTTFLVVFASGLRPATFLTTGLSSIVLTFFVAILTTLCALRVFVERSLMEG